jgi:large subunit ribosomal protein L1
MSQSKAYAEKAKQVEKKRYSPKEAVKLLKQLKPAKFDETVELHFNLGIDPRHADQQLRGTLILPHGTGKEVRIAVIAQGENVELAKKAGAVEAGSDDLIERIAEGFLDFDLLVATPDMMGKLGKLGRQLGSKGLMPNPKSGTVTTDIAKTVSEFKSGKLEYRNDKNGNLHLGIGKISFSEEQLIENFETLYDAVVKMKPGKAKGVYLKSVTLCPTMGPGISVETLRVRWKDN